MRNVRMPPRALLLLAVVLAALGACGRRGPLEPPGGLASVAPARVAGGPATGGSGVGGPAIEGQSNPPGQATVDDADAERDALVGSPLPTPPRGGRRRAYDVPRTPFVLDPLL